MTDKSITRIAGRSLSRSGIQPFAGTDADGKIARRPSQNDDRSAEGNLKRPLNVSSDPLVYRAKLYWRTSVLR